MAEVINIGLEHTRILVGQPCAPQVAVLFKEANVRNAMPPLNGASQRNGRKSSADTGKLAVCDFVNHVALARGDTLQKMEGAISPRPTICTFNTG